MFRLYSVFPKNCLSQFNKTRIRVLSSISVSKFDEFKNSSVEAVVIGGGAVGVSAAYHLAKYGIKDVVLLEKSELTSGSTWHAAGLITTFQTSVNAKKINLFSVELFKQLEEETGQDVGFHTPGSLRLITTSTRMDEAKYQMTRQHWNKAEQHLVGPDKVMELCPILNPENILGGVYNVGDGHIDPYSLTQAMAIGARKYGATIIQRCPVKRVELTCDDKWKVWTDEGSLVTKHLINASGFYAEEVCRLCGIDHYVPIVPVHHQYFITKPLPEVVALKTEFPVLRDLEGSYYLRQEKNSLLVGPYETPERMDTCDSWVNNKVPEFDKELFPNNMERIMSNVESAMHRVPCLTNAEISSVINGPITYNCQNVPLLGPIQGVPNYWQMVGFGYGIAQSGGAGHYIASWIKNGEPPHELIDLDAERFGRWCTKEFALAKARETYGNNNFPTYPKEERWAGRPSKRCGPLYSSQLEKGAQMGFVAGWEKPLYYAKTESESGGIELSFRRSNWFSAVEREVKSVLNNVGLVDLSSFAKYYITGPKSSEFLDLITANTLPKLGGTCITHMLSPRGRVYAELTLTHLEQDNKYMVVTGATSEFHDLWWLEGHCRDMGYSGYVKFENVTDRVGVLGIAGPRTREFLQPITEQDLSADAYKFLQLKSTKVCGIDVDIIRISYTGELGWEIYCPSDKILELYHRLFNHGKSFELSSFGAFALNSLRIEKGFRMWSADMTMDTNPIEAGLGFFVKPKKKADFIGKQSIIEILNKPLCRQLVFLQIDTDDVDADGDETVFFNDEIVGNVTSGSFGFQVNKSLAMAYLKSEHAVTGQSVTVELLGRRCPAIVALEPPAMIQPMRERLEKKTL